MDNTKGGQAGNRMLGLNKLNLQKNLDENENTENKIISDMNTKSGEFKPKKVNYIN